MRPSRALVAACALAGALLLGAAPAVAADGDGIEIGVTVPESTDTAAGSITNAELRWGLNRETSSGAFAGGCNFLSAGAAGDAGSAHVWGEGEGLYSAQQGAVGIVKATAAGGWEPSSFATKCLDTAGAPVSVNSLTSSSQSQVVITGGTGSATTDGGVSIGWSGAFSVVFYGGMTYWTATDPQLTLDAAGNGQLTATAGGFGTSMEDMTKWVPIAPRTIVLAELREVSIDEAGGFVQIPEYLGVTVADAGQTTQTSQNAGHWGSFPASFVDFQKLTGQTGYWLSTGGQRDAAKPASALTVNYDAAAPAFVPPTDAGAEPGGDPQNPIALRGGPAAVAVQDALQFMGNSPVSFARGALSALIPEAVAGAVSPLLLPLGGALLAVLTSLILLLHLSGRLPLPWTKAPEVPPAA